MEWVQCWHRPFCPYSLLTQAALVAWDAEIIKGYCPAVYPWKRGYRLLRGLFSSELHFLLLSSPTPLLGFINWELEHNKSWCLLKIHLCFFRLLSLFLSLFLSPSFLSLAFVVPNSSLFSQPNYLFPSRCQILPPGVYHSQIASASLFPKLLPATSNK